jgi:Ca-activated chloride channel family protein
MRAGRHLLGLGLLAGLSATTLAQGPDNGQQPVFRTGTETVAIYATALDRYGNMVLEIPRESFSVIDDGRPQTLTVFKSGLEPITAVILLDTSASMTANLELARSAAEQFVIRMLPGDKARIGMFNGKLTLSPEFTGDRDQLLAAFGDELQFGNPTRLWDSVEDTMTALAPLEGRRVIMLLTDGMDTSSAARLSDVLTRAKNEDLMIYIAQFRSSPRANLAEVPLSPTAGELFSGDPRLRNPTPTDGLRELATQTGGGHFLLGQSDDVNTTFTHVMEELHYQYLLGFTPQRLDGRVHEVAVGVDRPDVTIRARRTYLAPRPPTGGQP